MQSLSEMMRSYEHYHEKSITKFTHFIGVPAIVFSVQIVFSWISIFGIAFSWWALIFLLIYYCFLDVFLACMSAVFLIPITWFAGWIAQSHFNYVALAIFFLAFIGGWILQLIGHYFEGKRPALVDNIFQIFTAPIFLVAELMHSLGYKPRHLS